MRTLSSKLRKYFKEHIDKILTRVVFLLVALAVAVMVSESIESCLQELLGLNEKGKYEVLKAIGFCIVGVLLVLQALAANKRAKAMEDATENTEEGQRQERLKNAIEHLGHKRDSVRMGGTYELFHLAKDTRDLRQTVMDILCAHIRQTTGGDYKEKHETKPSEEIQGLLTLLFMQEHDVFEGCSINLQGSYLNGATLTQARLKKANLIEAQLQRATLWEARLQEADLTEAQLQSANLWEAQLQGAYLRRAQLQRANLRQAHLQRAELWDAQLQGATLWVAELQGAYLSATKMQGANLWHVKLQGTELVEAQLQGACFYKAQLQGANLRNAQLQGANLSKAQLQGADIGEARLQGVSSQTNPLPLVGFESRIRNRIDELSDLTGIIFAGGLKQEDLEALCGGLSDDQAQELRKKITPHIGQPASHELPENSGATTGAYTQEEAEEWIAEYNEAIRKASASRADNTADAASTPDSDKDKED